MVYTVYNLTLTRIKVSVSTYTFMFSSMSCKTQLAHGLYGCKEQERPNPVPSFSEEGTWIQRSDVI